MRIIPWTVNDTTDMRAMKSMGTDGLITDYPNRARKLKLALNAAKK
jgi:glycerophosphoryl diester phosphodiesterase